MSYEKKVNGCICVIFFFNELKVQEVWNIWNWLLIALIHNCVSENDSGTH